jgi:uncharacterized caspase-like protein
MGRHICSSAVVSLFMLAACLTPPAIAQQRAALIIGNSAYTHAAVLANPVNDANAMATTLKGLGFEVLVGLDLDKRGMDLKVRDFSRLLTTADAGVFFYAGHGLQVAGRNYLIPTDAQLESERDIDFEAVGLDFILKQMELGRENKTNIVFLDACRDNPLARNLARSMGTRSASVGQGLAQVQAGVGTFIAYSTQPGNVALDGSDGNSPFAGALARSLKQPGRNLNAVMIDVRRQVLVATGGKQVPWDHSALTGDFYFGVPLAAGEGRSASPEPSPELEAMKARVRDLEDELKSKPSAQQSANIAKLEQVKERVRQIEEANRADQQRIFDTYRKYGPTADPNARANLNREIGGIQLQMVRRNQEQKGLREEIARLEKETGLTQ